jgi:hypothetical protein
MNLTPVFLQGIGKATQFSALFINEQDSFATGARALRRGMV